MRPVFFLCLLMIYLSVYVLSMFDILIILVIDLFDPYLLRILIIHCQFLAKCFSSLLFPFHCHLNRVHFFRVVIGLQKK